MPRDLTRALAPLSLAFLLSSGAPAPLRTPAPTWSCTADAC